MSEHPQLHPLEGADGVEPNTDLADYCARPACRKQFQQSSGRGRRREFCSDVCRRLADKEYKQAKSMVEHFEKLARRQRHSVLAFGRAPDADEESGLAKDVCLLRATQALERAAAVLTFAQGRDPQLLGELEALREGVLPLVHWEQTG